MTGFEVKKYADFNFESGKYYLVTMKKYSSEPEFHFVVQDNNGLKKCSLPWTVEQLDRFPKTATSEDLCHLRLERIGAELNKSGCVVACGGTPEKAQQALLVFIDKYPECFL